MRIFDKADTAVVELGFSESKIEEKSFDLVVSDVATEIVERNRLLSSPKKNVAKTAAAAAAADDAAATVKTASELIQVSTSATHDPKNIMKSSSNYKLKMPKVVKTVDSPPCSSRRGHGGRPGHGQF